MTGPTTPKHYSLAMIPHGLDGLRSLAQFDYLLADQVAKRWFVGERLADGHLRAEAAASDVCKRKCLKRLRDNGWIERVMVFHDHPRSGHTFRDGVYLLTAAGRKMLASHDAAKPRPRRGLKERIYNQK